jgi:hypothetical protein
MLELTMIMLKEWIRLRAIAKKECKEEDSRNTKEMERFLLELAS